MFTQDGTFAPPRPYTGEVSLSFAGNTTKAGTYDVQISQSAAQATASGAVLASGRCRAAEQLTVSMGTDSAQYTTASGESLTDVAAGLNAAFASAGMSVSAQVANGGQQLVLTSDDYGSQAGFTVTSTNSASGTPAWPDLHRDRRGRHHQRRGRHRPGPVPERPLSDPTLAGLSVQVTTPGISSLTDLGIAHLSTGHRPVAHLPGQRHVRPHPGRDHPDHQEHAEPVHRPEQPDRLLRRHREPGADDAA